MYKSLLPCHMQVTYKVSNQMSTFVLQQGLEIRRFWFQKRTVQLKTALCEVYAYVLNGHHSVALQHNGVKFILESLLIAVFLIGRLKVLLDMTSGPEVWQIFKIWTVFHLGRRTFNTFENRKKKIQNYFFNSFFSNFF